MTDTTITRWLYSILEKGNVLSFTFHVASMAKPNEIRSERSVSLTFEQTRRNDMVNIKRSANRIFCDSANGTGTILFFTYLCTNDLPSTTMRRPSTFPRRIVFKLPIGGFPLAETGTITKELLLSSFTLKSMIPGWNFFILFTVGAGDNDHLGAIFPSKRQAIFCRARLGAKNLFGLSVSLNLKFLLTQMTRYSQEIWLAGRIKFSDIFASAGRGTKTTVLSWFSQFPLFNIKFTFALRANDLNPWNPFHAPNAIIY